MFYSLLLTLHVIGVVIWIGGVAFVTIIVFPMIMRMEGSFEKMLFFQGVEHRFAKIAKACVVIVGITGFWLLYLANEWGILFTKGGIGPTLMLIVWTVYLLILLLEGRLFKVIFKGEAQKDTAGIFFRLTVFHWVVLALSLTAVGIGVLSGHGGFN
jgi:uncharacterized membrane protein